MLKRPVSLALFYDDPRSEIFLVDFLVRFWSDFHFSKSEGAIISDRAETLAEGF